jgi:hypothetical protein
MDYMIIPIIVMAGAFACCILMLISANARNHRLQQQLKHSMAQTESALEAFNSMQRAFNSMKATNESLTEMFHKAMEYAPVLIKRGAPT